MSTPEFARYRGLPTFAAFLTFIAIQEPYTMTFFSENINRIDSFPECSPSELAELLSAPFVVTGHVKKWPAFKKWTAEFFSERYGDHVVNVAALDEQERPMTIKEYFAYFTALNEGRHSGELYYLRDWNFEHLFPELQSDYTTPPMFNSWTDDLPVGERPTLRWIYIGVKGTGSSMHLDTMDTSAWNAVIKGKKLWTFIPPATDKIMIAASAAAPREDAIICIQNEGDLVFTPSGWLHQVENLESGISLTENFVNITNYLAVRQFLIDNDEMDHVALLDQLKNEHCAEAQSA
ncbi:cupin-like domain-containing protein [Massilia scottii]|uniref:cupin-like domain-containing protein n=1 Tax=Massilia scottii TaxID=3057166 RepID=UPI00279686E3|nr:cupin-like domain-containing protein [Massilia sp. CCM 9029]MDQ1830401.1 cupin-like domain-containing protein [Massilia sp. CCM 9029]